MMRVNLFLLAIFILPGCQGNRTTELPAPTPGVSFQLTSSEKGQLEKRALHGDVAAMKELANYYILSEGDEELGISWLEKAGDAGDMQSRKIVMKFFKNHSASGGDKRLLELENRWGAELPKDPGS